MHLNEAIIIISTHGVIVLVNPVAQRLFGYGATELLGQNVFVLMPPDIAALHDGYLARRSTRSSTIRHIDTVRPLWAKHRDGSLFQVELSITLSHAPTNAEPCGYIGVIRPRDKKILAHALEREAQQQFVSNVSHELRTPLHHILGTVEMLLDDAAPLTVTQRMHLQSLRTATSFLGVLVNDILDFSAASTDKHFKLMHEKFLVRQDLLDPIHQIMRPLIYDKGLDFLADMDPTIPCEMVGDHMRIRQMLLNLLTNALKFTQHGHIRLNVTVDPAGRLRCTVSDSGIGIDDLSRVFQPFWQAQQSSTRQYGGSGLGLSIVKQLATQMGGTVGVTSTHGVGSEFWFTGPVCEPVHTVLPVPTVLPVHTVIPALIIVVDDHALNRRIMMHHVQRLGYRCQTTNDGQDALDLIRTGIEHVCLLLDGHMPRMDGFECARILRRDGYMLPIVAVTGDGDQNKCLTAGMNLYMQKPVTLSALRGVLQSIHLEPVDES